MRSERNCTPRTPQDSSEDRLSVRFGLAIAVWLILGPVGETLGGGSSLRFHGNTANDVDRVKILIDGPAVPADVGVGDFTIEWWMKANLADNPAGSCSTGNDGWIPGHIIIDRDVFGDGDWGDYGISMAAGRIGFGVSQAGSGATVCGGIMVADGAWHHVAVTRNATTGLMRLFVDGQFDSQITGPVGDVSYRDGRATGSGDSDPYLVFGAEKHSIPSQISYSGWMDEVRLSTVERYTTNFTPPTSPFVPDPQTAALYHFDEGSGSDVFDSSGQPGGPSDGFINFGGTPVGPEWSSDTPFGFSPTPTPTPLPNATMNWSRYR